MPVPAGSFVTVRLTGEVFGLLFDSHFESLVSDELAQIPMGVRSVSIHSPDLVSAVLSGQWVTYRYDAVVVVQTRVEYAALDDVRAIVVHVFADQGGSLPSGSSVALTGADVQPSSGGSLFDRAVAAAAAPAGALNTDFQILIVGLVLVAAVGVAVFVVVR
jgi:hypothetical protein